MQVEPNDSAMPPIRRVARIITGGTNPRAFLYWTFRRIFGVRANVVLIESHKGKLVFGNPYYLARHLLNNPRHANLKIYCALEERNTDLTLKDIRFCSPFGLKYIFLLATAEYLINDTSFPTYLSRRPAQYYLNTWHGTPLKTLGIKAAKGVFANLRNMQRNLLHSSSILFPNAHTQRVLLDDFMLKGIWFGKEIHTGYPRNDILQNPLEDTDSSSQSAFNVAFMPTWRGTHASVKADSTAYLESLYSLLRKLDTEVDSNVVFWIKLHPLVSEQLELNSFLRITSFPSGIEPYEHLSKCHLLITDYSSVMFDFMCTGRPVVLFLEDQEAYRSERDFCLDISKLPFHRTAHSGELISTINSASRGELPKQEEGDLSASDFVGLERGESSRDVCNQFFVRTGRQVPEHSISERLERIVIFTPTNIGDECLSFVGDLALSLAKANWDVVLCPPENSAKEVQLTALCRSRSEIRLIPATCGPPIDAFSRLRMFPISKLNDRSIHRLGREEWQRLFGDMCVGHIAAFRGGVMSRQIAPLCHCKSAVWISDQSGDATRQNEDSVPRALELAGGGTEVLRVHPVFSSAPRNDPINPHLCSIGAPTSVPVGSTCTGWLTLDAVSLVETFLRQSNVENTESTFERTEAT